MENEVIHAIKSRRTVKSFTNDPVSEEQIRLILESGTWAPSWLNIQPWKFIVVTDPTVKEKICSHVPVIEKAGMGEAPVCVAVCVEEYTSASHLAEDGATATLAMALAAHSLGLGTYWVGIYDRMQRRNSTEEKLKRVLHIPDNFRLISLMPIGTPLKVPHSKRKSIEDVVCFNHFSGNQESRMSSEQMLKTRIEIEDQISFSDQIDPEMGNIRK